MVGFYLLALGVAAGLLWIPYGEWMVGGRIHPRLTIFCVAGAGIILWSIFPRPDRFEEPGPVLEPERHSRLFTELRAVASAVNQTMPAEVYLIPDVNAWVAQRGGMMGFGSRRVMGLGLPLLLTLRVDQLRAVLAHEFGHFDKGDTMLGPWLYKTRAAIGRTLQGLQKYSGLLQAPFQWYGMMFLRVSHAVSRRQELSADELACRHYGADALIGGLRTIHGTAVAFSEYMNVIVSPVLQSRHRPPLAEGFSRFLHAKPVAKGIEELLQREVSEGEGNPYDTHPPLRERVEAAERYPAHPVPEDPAPAISLLEEPQKMENRLIQEMTGLSARWVDELVPVSWEEVGVKVYINGWKDFISPHKEILERMRAGSLPKVIQDFDRLADDLRRTAKRHLPPEEMRSYAHAVLGAALAVALHAQGWEIVARPECKHSMTRGDLEIRPFAWIAELMERKRTPQAWWEACKEAGILDTCLFPAS